MPNIFALANLEVSEFVTDPQTKKRLASRRFKGPNSSQESTEAIILFGCVHSLDNLIGDIMFRINESDLLKNYVVFLCFSHLFNHFIGLI